MVCTPRSWNMKDKMLADHIFWRKLWQLAAPIALQNLMLASVAAADALMLGRVTQQRAVFGDHSFGWKRDIGFCV